jgi:hypothetical protein
MQVPIRDSVLTKLLAEGLVNAAATVMLACVGPTLAQVEQSTATLHFAAVAQRIRMKPVMRLDPHDQVCFGRAPVRREYCLPWQAQRYKTKMQDGSKRSRVHAR